MGRSDGAEEGSEFAVRVQVSCTERDGSLAVFDQVAAGGANRGKPVGDIVRVSDRSGEQQQPCLGRAKDDGFFPDDTSFRISQIL